MAKEMRERRGERGMKNKKRIVEWTKNAFVIDAAIVRFLCDNCKLYWQPFVKQVLVGNKKFNDRLIKKFLWIKTFKKLNLN